MRILVTGAAGFIGHFVSLRLVEAGHQVTGVDNLNDYYDPQLKRDRLARASEAARTAQASGCSGRFSFVRMDLAEAAPVEAIFAEHRFDRVVHLAAQAGVAHSIENPFLYVRSNIAGFAHVLEGCRRNSVEHLVYASTSSVYGASERLPYSVDHGTDHPLSLYAATKKANEAMAHSYSHLYAVPATGLRFFTVYGPWGRPDMACYLFARQILAGEPITLYNRGQHRRDWTYIDDIAEGVVRVLMKVPEGNDAWDGQAPDPGSSRAPYRLYNIGSGRSVHLLEFVGILEELLGAKAIRKLVPRRSVDVSETAADVERLRADVGYQPSTPVQEGLRRFVEWYGSYHDVP